MSNYIRGLKRQQIIDRWIHGHDDPEYEVFPTKKEGKYIVKKRTEPLETKEEVEPYGRGSESLEQNEVNDEVIDEEHEEPKSKPTPKPAPKPKPTPKRITSKQTTSKDSVRGSEIPNSDLTIGIEILEHLKLLGEEMKHQRKKKEQKEVIKQVVQKQLTRTPRSRKIVKVEKPDYSEEEDYDYEEPTPTPPPSKHKQPQQPSTPPESTPPPQPVFRSRIRNSLI